MASMDGKHGWKGGTLHTHPSTQLNVVSSICFYIMGMLLGGSEVNKMLVGAALALVVSGCVLICNTNGCRRMHGKHESSHGKCNLVH